jgi:chemotaxis protein MotB
VSRKKKEEHVNHERWLVSYADFITLLFAFFVVMFSVSQVDKKELGRLVESLNRAFDLPGGSTHPIQGVETTVGLGVGTAAIQIAAPRRQGREPGGKSEKRSGDSTALLRGSMEKLIEKLSLTGKVVVHEDGRGLVITLSEASFFDPGSARVRTDVLPALRQIGELLKSEEVKVSVEGHTDNTPINTSEFPSNWELSTARATSIVSMMMNDLGYDPRMLSAAGFSEYKPIASNATPEGRAKNRRVDLVVIGTPRKPAAS